MYETVVLETLDIVHQKAMIFEDRKQNEPHDYSSLLPQATIYGLPDWKRCS